MFRCLLFLVSLVLAGDALRLGPAPEECICSQTVDTCPACREAERKRKAEEAERKRKAAEAKRNRRPKCTNCGSKLLDDDAFMVLADFRAYTEAQARASDAWRNDEKWTRMSILNVARIGRFSSDRSIREYCRSIWHVKPVPIQLEESLSSNRH